MAETLASYCAAGRRRSVSRRQFRRLYRLVAMAYHPDHGGSSADMARASAAYRKGDVSTLLSMLRRHRARLLMSAG